MLFIVIMSFFTKPTSPPSDLLLSCLFSVLRQLACRTSSSANSTPPATSFAPLHPVPLPVEAQNGFHGTGLAVAHQGQSPHAPEPDEDHCDAISTRDHGVQGTAGRVTGLDSDDSINSLSSSGNANSSSNYNANSSISSMKRMWHEEVFILDLLQLDPGLVGPTLTDLFCNASILKLGYSFKDDLNMLRSSFPSHPHFATSLQVKMGDSSLATLC